MKVSSSWSISADGAVVRTDAASACRGGRTPVTSMCEVCASPFVVKTRPYQGRRQQRFCGLTCFGTARRAATERRRAAEAPR